MCDRLLKISRPPSSSTLAAGRLYTSGPSRSAENLIWSGLLLRRTDFEAAFHKCYCCSKMASSIVSRGTKELSRRIHTQVVNCAGYQINYDQLREGTPKNLPPTTVQGNVKNVVGWRGGAERGFLATYPNCIHVLTEQVTKEAPSMATWYRKVIFERYHMNCHFQMKARNRR